MAISNYLRKKILNHVFRGEVYTPPTAWYVSLYTNNPTSADTGTEVSGTGYIRQPISYTAPSSVDGKEQIENTADIEFPQAGSNWGTITHAGIRDALTGGNLLYFGPLNDPKLIETSDVMKVLAGELKQTLE